jgi:hypothetical protein
MAVPTSGGACEAPQMASPLSRHRREAEFVPCAGAERIPACPSGTRFAFDAVFAVNSLPQRFGIPGIFSCDWSTCHSAGSVDAADLNGAGRMAAE